jgi:glutaminyl-tRNA synthetase
MYNKFDKIIENNTIITTRFPPEPNGHLHLGHAKAMNINFNYAKSSGGKCYLRFDDTNPSKEKIEYIDSIIEDVKWLGFEPYKITYTSDYFEKLIEFAFKLIKKDKAYICELESEKMREDRRNCIASPFRDRPMEESLNIFQKMIDGEFDEGKYTLRLKMDMSSNNPNMRDLVAYRIIKTPHPRTKNKYNIYPSYDFSHCIVDSLEGITHSLCSIEFKSRNESYQWVLDVLDLYKPTQIEYVRLSIENVELSKRKLLKLIDDNIVSGWDDPRLPTIKGLRRRGYTKDAILNFCDDIGINVGGSSSIVKYERLEHHVRMNLDITAPRKLAVIDPIKIIIINNDTIESVSALDFPSNTIDSSTRNIDIGNTVYINRSDFELVPNKKYKRLTTTKIVRLKYAFPIKYISHESTNDIIDTIYVEKLPMDAKVSATIGWVSDDYIDIEIREFCAICAENSIKITNAFAEKSLLDSNIEDKFQFERVGYFSVDKDSTKDKKIFNKIIDLKNKYVATNKI